METVPLAEAKERLSTLVSEILSTHEHYTITQDGRPAVVLLPVDDLEALEETIFWLEREVEQLRAGTADPEGADTSGEEMTELLQRRHPRTADAA
jgi:prevent-host-death family protein